MSCHGGHSVQWEFHGRYYEFVVRNPNNVSKDAKKVEVYGTEISGNVLPLLSPDHEHNVCVTMG